MQKYQRLENGLLYVELDGRQGYYELGRQNGEVFKELIAENISKMRRLYCENCTPEQLDQILADIRGSRYIADLQKYVPGLYDEIRGIADGSGASFEDIMMLNYLEEVPNALPSGKCTATSLTGRANLPNMIFQNMDFTDAYHGFEAVYKIRFADKSILMYGFVGQFGGIGLNSKGLGDTINVICNSPSNKGFGLPSTAILRMILEQDTIEDCEKLLKSVPASTAGCYMITDSKSTVVFEVSANNIERIDPDERGFLVHTNHAIKTKDVCDVPGSFRGAEPIYDENGKTDFQTFERYALMTELMSKEYQTFDAKDAMRILCTPPVNAKGLMCGLELLTLQSMIAVCDPKDPHMFVSQGNDVNRKFAELHF